MSLLRKSARPAAAPAPQVVTAKDMYFNIQPQSHPGVVAPTAEKLRVQQHVMGSMQRQCADLFSANPACRSFQHGSEIFHTSQMYGESVSVEELAHNLKEHDLCLAISATAPSAGSSALSMLDASHLTPENCLAGQVAVETGSKGSMVVSFQKGAKGLHYIKSVDFHVGGAAKF